MTALKNRAARIIRTALGSAARRKNDLHAARPVATVSYRHTGRGTLPGSVIY
ncbi:MAG: hypothetical protein Q4G40_12765 [Brachybacterium sp.]|nr:hypothetical protein [Brachybacterium sp.]